MKNSCTRLVIVVGLTISAHSAYSGQMDLSELSLEQLLEVNVYTASKYEQRVADAPSAVQVISREDIKRNGWRTVTEALNSLPGVYSVNDRAYDYIGARGFQIPGDYNTRFLLLVDGQRNNDNIYQQALVGSEGWLDMSVVERIEYVPGPGSVMYGSNAMYGVINIVTRSAEKKPLNLVSTYASQLGLAGVNILGSRQMDDTGLLLQYSTEHMAGHDQAYPAPLNEVTGLDSGSNRHLLMRIDQGEWGIKLISHERSVYPSSALYGTVVADPALKLNDGGSQLTTFVQHQTSADSSILARLAYTDWHFRGTYPYQDPSAAYYLNFDDTHGQSLEGEFSFNFRFAAHRVVTGFDFSRDLLARQQNYSSVSAVSLGTAEVNINPLVNRRGLFIQDEWRMTRTWLLSLGLRSDVATNSRSSDSPRVALIWQPNQEWNAKLLAGRAYRSPNAYESQFSNGMTNLGNAELLPETIRTTEGVVEWSKNGQTHWMLSVFENNIEQLIHEVDTSGTGLLQFQNGSWARVRGAEFGVEHTNADKLRLRSSVAYNSSSNGLNTAPENSPLWIGKFFASAPVPGAAAYWAADVQTISGRNYSWSNTRYHVGTECLANATLTFPNVLSRGMQAQLRLTNLFDRQLHYPSSPDMATPMTPGWGRNLTAIITYEF